MLAGGRAGNDRGDVTLDGRPAERLMQRIGIVFHFGILDRHAAPLPHEGRQHSRVEFDNRSRLGLLARLDQLVPRRNDPHSRMGLHRYRRVPTGQQRAQIVGPQAVGARQKQFRGDYVLAHQSHVVPGRHRLENLHGSVIELADFFDHDDGIGPGR